MVAIKVGSKKIREEQLTLFICTIVVLLAQISGKSGSATILILGYVIALVWSLYCGAPMLMAMNLFFLSDNSILDAGGISIQLVVMCIYLIRFSMLKKKKLYGKTLLFGIAIAAYSFIYIDLGISYVLQGVKLAMMIVFLTEYLGTAQSLTRENYEKQLSFAVLGVFISVAAAIYVNPAMLLSSRIALSEDSNWNLFGILSALLFSHSFVMCFFDKKKGIPYITYSILMAVCTLMSTSRTALLVAAIGVIWTLLFINENGTIARKGLIFATIIIFLILLANGTIQISFVDKLVDRIVNPRRGDVSNGRFDLWRGYVEYLLSHTSVLWFGYGKTLVQGITTSTSSLSNMAHNMFIEQLTMNGIVGSGIVTVIYGTSIEHITHVARSEGGIKVFKKRYIISVLLVFIAGMFSHIITSVLVTTELYIGIMQYMVLNEIKSKG